MPESGIRLLKQEEVPGEADSESCRLVPHWPQGIPGRPFTWASRMGIDGPASAWRTPPRRSLAAPSTAVHCRNHFKNTREHWRSGLLIGCLLGCILAGLAWQRHAYRPPQSFSTGPVFHFSESFANTPAGDKSSLALLDVKPLAISGAQGANAVYVNGVFDPTGTLYNGKPLYHKRDDPFRWLRWVTGPYQSWRVSDTADKDAHNDRGYSCSNGANTESRPMDVKIWYVWLSKWEKQDLTLVFVDPLPEQEVETKITPEEEAAVATVANGSFDDPEQYKKTLDRIKRVQPKTEKPWMKRVREIKHGNTDGGRWIKTSVKQGHKKQSLWKKQQDVWRKKFATAMAKLLKLDHNKMERDTPRIIIMSHFLSDSFLNGKYTEKSGDNYTVNGRETYWQSGPEPYFLYLCLTYGKWMIAYKTAFRSAIEGDCNFWAQGTEGAEVTENAENSDWYEWDPSEKSLMLRRKAGPELVTSVAEQALRVEKYDAWHGNPVCGKPAYDRGVRNQGTMCNNCWAMATAVVMQWRLCMNSNHSFSGENAFISASYITSCATPAFTESNGCDGGDMLASLRWVGEHGVPTGGNGDNEKTCVPNFVNGMVLDNAPPPVSSWGTFVPPPCPTTCTNKKYPRPLEKDLFKLGTLGESWRTTAFESATSAIKSSGPIMINFDVYDDFRNDYVINTTTGDVPIYKRSNATTNKFLFRHVVVAIGYSYMPKFLICVNSWGNAWGKQGRFKIDPRYILNYVIPGEVGPAFGDPLPLPLPNGNGGFFMWTAGFSVAALNNKWTPIKANDAAKFVAGKRTLWNIMGTFFVYYCKPFKKWAITSKRNLAGVRRGLCFWHAAQGNGCHGLLDFECDWNEYRDLFHSLVLVKGSGVSGVTYA